MSGVQDLQRTPMAQRMINMFRRRKRHTADEGGGVVNRKTRGWSKLRVSWVSKGKAGRAVTKDDGDTASGSSLNPRNDEILRLSNDPRKADTHIGEFHEVAPPDPCLVVRPTPSDGSERASERGAFSILYAVERQRDAERMPKSSECPRAETRESSAVRVPDAMSRDEGSPCTGVWLPRGAGGCPLAGGPQGTRCRLW
ncbi:hypothetical protein FA13DRAFT_171287 [Coprinellus micaceus]|uniref:Uncharacterized protein n=1 Tax=Coprinellus micaceus TaxID=71717 RepID=A0A4Y7SGR5_COPMI|nr:hypothetical protein FA13DRAFT_171287 [Coprinellus micaceus]